MNPVELIDFLEKLISKNLNISTMIWGPPGIGKSSIVAAAAEKASIDFIDLRLSQLAPTDLSSSSICSVPKSDLFITSIDFSEFIKPFKTPVK